MDYGSILLSLITILVGVLLTFWGLKLFKFLVPIIGFVFGYSVGLNLINIGTIAVTGVLTILLPIIIGLIFAILAFLFYELGIAISLAAFTFTLVNTLFLTFGSTVNDAYVWAVIAAIVAFIATFVLGLYRYFVVFSTSVNGSYYTLLGGLALFGLAPITWVWNNSLDYKVLIQHTDQLGEIAILIGFFALIVVGIYYQLMTNPE